jgi:hypothetical protein
MEKAYARVGEEGVSYFGPKLADEKTEDMRLAVFGPKADQVVSSPEVQRLVQEWKDKGQRLSLIPIQSDSSWGKASTGLVQAVYQQRVLGIVTLDRNSGHLAEQIGTKAFVPVMAISSDMSLTSVNIPLIFRLPEGTSAEQAVRTFTDAIARAGANREQIRNVLASGEMVGKVRFSSTGEMQ